jgi:hypothetical protein
MVEIVEGGRVVVEVVVLKVLWRKIFCRELFTARLGIFGGRLLASQMRIERPFSKSVSSLLYANISKFNLSAFPVYSSNVLLAATWTEIGTFLQMQHPSHPPKPISHSSSHLSLTNNHNQTLSTPEPPFEMTK